MQPIATLTMNPALDVNSETEQVVFSRKLRCGRPLREPGVGGINVARAVTRLGGEARAIFVAGGVVGARLTALVAAAGVEAYPIEIADETRETVNVTERSTGAQFRFVMESPSLAEAEWTAVLEAIAALDLPPAYLVASGTLPGGVPAEFYGRLSHLAAERSIRLVVDTSGVALRHAVGPGTSLIKPNLAELRELTGSPGGSFSDFFLEGAAAAPATAWSPASCWRWPAERTSRRPRSSASRPARRRS
ncbi:MAG TPA: PfkB family carbohydrate kinase [Thermoanaerobaculia bacterium]|nr:PfkB family carbohydrate kinase [Thermoanaerobaculia bacterium]